MPPPQNRSADGTPSDSIDEDEDNRQVDIDNVWADAFEPLLAHPMADPGKQIMNLKFLIGEYGELLNEDRTRAINVEYKRCLRQQDKSRRDANREHRLNAIAQYNAALKTVTFDPTLPTTQQSKRGELCKQFPPDVQRDFREDGMWWSAEEQQGFRRDPEKNREVRKYREGVASNTDTVVVARRKFQCRQPASPSQQCAANTVPDTSAAEQCEATTMPETSATESPASPPADVNEVRKIDRTTVEKRAETETDQSPPRIIANKPTINQTPANPEIDVDAQLERIFTAVANGPRRLSIAQARFIKREVARLRQLKR